MRIFVMRHGEASMNAASDELRPLTERGQQQVISTAEQLKKHVQIDRIIASPLLRAQQTAKLVADTLGIERLDTQSFLKSNSHPADTIKALSTELSEKEIVLLASHMPLVQLLIQQLTDQQYGPLAKAMAVELSGEHCWPGAMSLGQQYFADC